MAVATLAGCGDRVMEDYPSLVPAEQVLAEPVLPPHAAADPDAVTSELAGQRGDLAAEVAEAQAAAPVAPGLAGRGAALQARAAAIRAEACAEASAAGGAAPDCPP